MQVSQAGIDLIKKHEGLRLRAYLCPAGVWTIGYGTTGPQVTKNLAITQAQAEAYLAADLVTFTEGVLQACAPKVPLQNELDAFVCFSYNIGLKAFASSTVLRQYKAGNKEAAAAGFKLWTKAHDPNTGQLVELPGLVQRRSEEMRLFMQDVNGGTVERTASPSVTVEVPESSVVPVPPKNIALSKEIIGGVVAGVGGLGQFASNISADDLQNAKVATQAAKTDASSVPFFAHHHFPEAAAGLTVVLSMLIIWKRLTDRKNGVR
jgi:lysozyme